MNIGDLVRISRSVATRLEIENDQRKVGIIVDSETRYNAMGKEVDWFVIVNWGGPDYCIYECPAGLEVINEGR